MPYKFSLKLFIGFPKPNKDKHSINDILRKILG